MFSLLASSVGNKSKEKGWGYPSQLSDRLVNYKNSEGKRPLTAARVAHRIQGKKSAAVAQQRRACRHPAQGLELKEKKKRRILSRGKNFPQDF